MHALKVKVDNGRLVMSEPAQLTDGDEIELVVNRASDTTQQGVTLALFQHVTDELRSRRQPEYAYTAAAVGAFGAIAWGVAALVALSNPVPTWRHPAIAGIVTVLLIAFPVIVKILQEHKNYVQLREDQQRLAKEMVVAYGLDLSWLPAPLRPAGKIGDAHRWSVGIVLGAGVGAVLFCLAVLLLPPLPPA
jgi:hypothetical protein